MASLGHPYKFQRVLRLGSVTARHLVLLLMAALWNTAGHYIFALWFLSFFLLLLLLLLFSPSLNPSGRRVDVYHTSTHGVALVRI